MRKIIQIAVTSHELNYPDNDSIFALCDDGTGMAERRAPLACSGDTHGLGAANQIPQTENKTIKKRRKCYHKRSGGKKCPRQMVIPARAKVS